MTKTELQKRLYREFINQLYYENEIEPIEPGTTIRLNWQTEIHITKEGADFLNKQLKELHEQITGEKKYIKRLFILPDPESR